ncbi:uncharacterized protein LOC133821232 [Humulus lupulus]|uniref:uncharacterized protein LOC133821232 n=1 Tax=Humulus lupulus TaxID=3486 RepID=UPI002B40AE0E|nr:uncharacterized protein LOC133821232 [Humulus lupulus]
MFDRYTAPAAPSSWKKESKWHRGESSNAPSTKKARTEDLPAAAPSKETTPPPAPLDQQSPLAPAKQNSTPPTPTNQTPQGNQPEDALTSTVVGSTRERIYKLSKHKRSREAIFGTNSMEANQIINRWLNEIASRLLTITAG